MITLSLLLFIGPAKEQKVVSRIGETDPHLLAIQNVFVTFAPRRRTRADDVRARARLSQTVSRQLFAFRLRHQILLLLLFRAPGVKRQRIQARVHRHRDPQERVHRFQFFADQTERNVIKAGAAKLFGNANAEQVQLGHFVEHFAVKLLLFVPFFDERRDFLLRKLAHGFDQGIVVFSKFQINHVHRLHRFLAVRKYEPSIFE